MDLEFHQLDRRYEALRLHRPACERRLLASLCEQGQQVPIVVVKAQGCYRVIDGFQRLRCLGRLGADTVRATLWELGPKDALLLDRSQRSSARPSAIEQGWLLATLRSEGVRPQELARRMDKSVSWVSRHLGLVSDLPAEVQEHVRRGAVPAHAAMRHLLPIARRSREDCLRLAKAVAMSRLSSREVGKLCSAFERSSTAVRERLLEEPRLFLRARAHKKQPPPQPAPLEMLRELGEMARAARRLRERLGDAEPSPAQLAELRLATAEVRSQLDAFEEEIRYVGREDPQHHPDPRPEEDHDSPHCQAAESLPQQRQESDRLAEQPAAEDPAAGEGRTLSPGDPGAVRELSGQSREGPRRASGSGRTALLSNSDGVLSPSRDRDKAQATGGQVQLRAGPGDATRHLSPQG